MSVTGKRSHGAMEAPKAERQIMGIKLVPVQASEGARNVDLFDIQGQVGEGMYGQVYKAQEKATGEKVALKKIRMDNEKEGFPITAIREIKILSLFHKQRMAKMKTANEDMYNCIITLKEIVNSRADDTSDNKGHIYMVFEYMEHDLSGILRAMAQKLTLPMIKSIGHQIVHGLNMCHTNYILHRDLKCSNILVNKKGEVKLADFGLARPTGDRARLTPKVITLWYRPPELLFGLEEYSDTVDTWSAGCILAELMLRGRPLFPGKDEADQIHKIMKVCGTPTEANWPGVSKLPLYERFASGKKHPPVYQEIFKRIVERGDHRMRPVELDDLKNLLMGLLEMNPQKRMRAEEALAHPFFFRRNDNNHGRQFESDYKAGQPLFRQLLQNLPDYHEYEQRVARQMERGGQKFM